MQPIERYGLITLLFLIVAVVAIVAWDGPETDAAGEHIARLEEQAADPDASRAATERATTERATTERATTERDAAGSRSNARARRDAAAAGTGDRTTTGTTAGHAAGTTERPSAGAAEGARGARARGVDPDTNAGTGGYNPFGGNRAAERDVAFVEDEGAAAPTGGGGLDGVPAAPNDPTVSGLAPSAGTVRDRSVADANPRVGSAAREAQPASDRRGERTASIERSANERSANGRGSDAATLPSGAFVVDGVPSKQLAREYGDGYQLWGSTGLVRALEEANSGVDMNRLAMGAILNRPSPERIAAARKDATGAVASTGASAAPTPSAPVVDRTTAVGGAVRYTIQPNDTLSGIALRTLGSSTAYPRIEALNPGLVAERLAVGDVILLPAGADANAAARSTDVAEASRESRPVASGDRPRIR